MEYNSNRPRLLLPEYGRMVQQMVDHALTIADRAERQAYAESIVRVMACVSPQAKNAPDQQQKLWDHLAYIAGYRLDIDYPCEINRPAENVRPPRMPYPTGTIRRRHYGKNVEAAIAKIMATPEGSERDELVRITAHRMKRNLTDWKGDGNDDHIVAHDISTYTDGMVNPDFSVHKLAYIPAAAPAAGNDRGKHFKKHYN